MNIFDKIINWFRCDEEYAVRKPEEQKQLNISQPIYEFVELMKSDFNRFDVVYDFKSYHVSITDKKTSLQINYSDYGSYAIFSRTEWVTHDEVRLIDETLTAINSRRQERIERVREWQNKRKRNKWVNVYCNNLEAK